MIICVVGPTGVGKTKLSVMLAKKYNGIIINADACQVYKYLDIGTAKIKEDEKEGIIHELFDIKNPNQDYSVSHYQADCRNTIYKYKDRNIILVGGTGLYIKASLFDYRFDKVNKNDYTMYSNEELYEMVKKIDNNTNIHINNRVRLENFLNKDNHEMVTPNILYKDVYFIGLTTDRDTLYERINNRVDEMIKEGLIEEVKELYNKYKDASILKRAIGYKEIISYLNNEISLDEAINKIKKNSRNYAKRQYTWFNNQMDIKWFNTDFENFNNTYKEVINYIDGGIK